MYDTDHHTVFFQIYVLLFIFLRYVALRDQYHEVCQAGCNEKPGAASVRVENPARKQPAGWNEEPCAASLRAAYIDISGRSRGPSGMMNQELRPCGNLSPSLCYYCALVHSGCVLGIAIDLH